MLLPCLPWQKKPQSVIKKSYYHVFCCFKIQIQRKITFSDEKKNKFNKCREEGEIFYINHWQGRQCDGTVRRGHDRLDVSSISDLHLHFPNLHFGWECALMPHGLARASSPGWLRVSSTRRGAVPQGPKPASGPVPVPAPSQCLPVPVPAHPSASPVPVQPHPSASPSQY